MTFLAQGTGEGTVKGRERMGIKEAQGREGKGVERGGEEGEGRDGKRKGREGMWGRFAARGWKGEGRKERQGGMGN